MIFVILFIIALAALVLLDGYAQYMGNPKPTSWLKLCLWAALIAIVVGGLLGVAADGFAAVQGLLQ
ncbi:hypothetical protein [Devosia sp.]|uniref:hypothetical protein n=1 Tax=Devosia sp. TaxID=1871048 RepID=UPI001ACD7F64|nr:hypothetical protein [Devosia sp.]MBN9335630.1 hypothetical protein [Devosia sp.]